MHRVVAAHHITCSISPVFLLCYCDGEAFVRGVVIPRTGVIGVGEAIVHHGLKPLESFGVLEPSVVPLWVPVPTRVLITVGVGVQLVGLCRDKVPDRHEVMTKEVLVRAQVCVGRQGVYHSCVAHPVGKSQRRGRAFPDETHHGFVGGGATPSVTTAGCSLPASTSWGELARAALRRSTRACRERWPERLRRRGDGWSGAEASAFASLERRRMR